MTDSTGILPQLKFMGLTALRPSMYIRTAINLLLGFAGVAAFLQLLIGGVLWIVAGGEKEAQDKARRRIMGALIGLALVFSAYALMFIIRALFGVDLIGFELTRIK